jgi:uncharacterized repeat protein (TIGR01451 family)
MDIEYSTDNGQTWTALPASGILSVNEDDTVLFRVKSDIPTAAQGGADRDIMNIELKATAYKDDESGPETETNGADTQDAVDIVLADGTQVQNGSTAGNLGDENNTKGDTAGDGIEVGRSGYIIATPILDLVKTSCVVSDPANGTTDPKRIPGAIIRYQFDIRNTGTADATNVQIKDTLNSNFVDGNDIQIANVVKTENTANCICTSPGNTAASHTENGMETTITGLTVSTAAHQQHTCVWFEVELQ